MKERSSAAGTAFTPFGRREYEISVSTTECVHKLDTTLCNNWGSVFNSRVIAVTKKIRCVKAHLLVR